MYGLLYWHAMCTAKRSWVSIHDPWRGAGHKSERVKLLLSADPVREKKVSEPLSDRLFDLGATVRVSVPPSLEQYDATGGDTIARPTALTAARFYAAMGTYFGLCSPGPTRLDSGSGEAHPLTARASDGVVDSHCRNDDVDPVLGRV